MTDDKIDDVEHLARILSRENAKEVMTALRAKCGVRVHGIVRRRVFVAVTETAIEEVFAELAPSFIRRERMMQELRDRANGKVVEAVPPAAADAPPASPKDESEDVEEVEAVETPKVPIPIQIMRTAEEAEERKAQIETASDKWRREMAEKRARRRAEEQERRMREEAERREAERAFVQPKPAGFSGLSLAEKREAFKRKEEEQRERMVEAMLRGTRGAAE